MCGTMIIKFDKTMATINTHLELLRGMNEPIMYTLCLCLDIQWLSFYGEYYDEAIPFNNG